MYKFYFWDSLDLELKLLIDYDYFGLTNIWGDLYYWKKIADELFLVTEDSLDLGTKLPWRFKVLPTIFFS
jgi:hypothetical protein